MEPKELIQHQFTVMRSVLDAVVKDLDDAQFNWIPPGTTNPIKANLLHAIAGEDSFVRAIIQGKPTIWEASGWAERFGLATPPNRGEPWDEIRGKAVSVAAVLAYQGEVRAATDAYLAEADAAELNRQVSFAGGMRPVAIVLATLVFHSTSHLGEIAAVKGLKGVKGLPF